MQQAITVFFSHVNPKLDASLHMPTTVCNLSSVWATTTLVGPDFLHEVSYQRHNDGTLISRNEPRSENLEIANLRYIYKVASPLVGMLALSVLFLRHNSNIPETLSLYYPA